MTKRFYEKGRFQYFSRNQLMVLDGPTFAAIVISLSVLVFCIVAVSSLRRWTHVLDTKPKNISTALEKKEGDLIALNFIEMPDENKQVAIGKIKTPPPEKLEDKKDPNAEEKIAKLEPIPASVPVAKPPQPPILPIVKKTEPVLVQEKKIEPKSSGPTSMAPDHQTSLSLNSTIEQAETEEHIFYRKILESTIEEKLRLYKTSFPDKWKTIPGSYIVDVDIQEGGKPVITLITSSPNFFFNQVSDVILKGIKYPPLKTYNLKKYHQTFIFTYRPYGEEQGARDQGIATREQGIGNVGASGACAST